MLMAVALMCLGSASFCMSDVLSKWLNQFVSPLETSWLRYLSFLIAILLIVARRPSLLITRAPWLQFWRGVATTVSSLLFMYAAYKLPLATATSIHFLSPIIITLLAIPLLGERVGIHRWAAVGVGFAGVLVIIRPATSGFDVWTLVPVVSATAWAASVILTKMIDGRDRLLTTLAYSSLIATVLQTLPIATFAVPTSGEIGLGIVIGLLTVVGQLCISYAFTVVEASLLAPFSYVQLIWASLLSFFVFGLWPDALTFVGMTMLAASGTYTAYRERVQRRHDQWSQPRPVLQNALGADS